MLWLLLVSFDGNVTVEGPFDSCAERVDRINSAPRDVWVELVEINGSYNFAWGFGGSK